MKRVILIFTGVLGGMLLLQWLLYSCERRKANQVIEDLRLKLRQCIDAPIKTDTILVDHVLKDTIYLTSTYRITDTVHDSPAVDWNAQSIQQRTYTGTYSHPQFEARWTALVTGTLDRMTVDPPSLIRSLIINRERTVPGPIETVYRERSHLYASLGGTVGKELAGVDAGLMYIRKEGWGLRVGIGTDFQGLTYNAGIIVKLK